MIWMLLGFLLVIKGAVLICAYEEAYTEAWALYKENTYKSYLVGNVEESLTNMFAKKQKLNQHFYFSIDRSVVFCLLIWLVFDQMFKLHGMWRTLVLVGCDLLGNLFWFKFWHDSLHKKFYNQFDHYVYTKGFCADSDKKSNAWTDKYFPDTWELRLWYLAVALFLLISEIVIYFYKWA